MVARLQISGQLLHGVARLYDWLDMQILSNCGLLGNCAACGRCCDFDHFDHRLFVTTPELLYLAANLGPENVKPVRMGRCPYNIGGKCSVYPHRFAGCRIFYCRGDAELQGSLSEAVVKRLKSLCTQSGIPYRYVDLPTALNDLTTANIGRWAGEHYLGGHED
jgi:Fe-S-cluster containining protein